MAAIQRWGASRRWSDVVVHRNVAYWVEVAADLDRDPRGQIEQVLAQIDATLRDLGTGREQLLQVVIYLADLADISILNELWDDWVVPERAPVRACVQAGLGAGCRVEMVITAATP
jgi:enamine deaminase RidA (YjgF/YER057c/UK114 family)